MTALPAASNAGSAMFALKVLKPSVFIIFFKSSDIKSVLNPELKPINEEGGLTLPVLSVMYFSISSMLFAMFSMFLGFFNFFKSIPAVLKTSGLSFIYFPHVSI